MRGGQGVNVERGGVHLRDQRIEGQTVRTEKSGAYLGPDLHLVGCHLVLATAAARLTMSGLECDRCRVEVKGKLKNFRFLWTMFRNCSFTGQYLGCDFGFWPESYGPVAGLERCDLSGAVLDGCRLIGCDLQGTTLPGWPHFTLLAPGRFSELLLGHSWPGEMSLVATIAAESEARVAAHVYQAELLAKELGLDPAELRACLEALREKAPEAVFY